MSVGVGSRCLLSFLETVLEWRDASTDTWLAILQEFTASSLIAL